MLQLDKVIVRRGERLLHYDFMLKTGKIMTLQGPSGIGKSTLFELIAGFIQPEQGDIRWQSRSLLSFPVEQRPVGLLFQGQNLFEHLSVMKNLRLGMGSQLKASGALKTEAVATQRSTYDCKLQQAAKALGVAELLTRKPPELSGGQRQRIALLRTLLRPEPLILLDEPFTGLDTSSRIQAAEWLWQTARAGKKTILLITHHDDDVSRLADLTVNMDETGIVSCSPHTIEEEGDSEESL